MQAVGEEAVLALGWAQGCGSNVPGLSYSSEVHSSLHSTHAFFTPGLCFLKTRPLSSLPFSLNYF